MKKIFTLFAACAVSVAAMAQSVVFCNSEGVAFANGSVLELSDYDGMYVQSGLHVTNTSNAVVSISIDVKITDITPESAVQFCFPTNCFFLDANNKNLSTEVYDLAAGEIKSLMTEWMPLMDESWENALPSHCTVEYSIMNNGIASQKVTVKYSYGESSNLQNVNPSQKVVGYYSLTGTKVSANQKGIIIQKMADGSARKIVNK